MKPFVKWLGGKTQLIKYISYPKEFKKYAEPFVGSGAIFLDVLSKFNNIESYISDINENLINVWESVKSYSDGLIEYLEFFKNKFDESEDKSKFYYDMRDSFNSFNILNYVVAACFIFLNKTGFNGLYRVNSSGEFNAAYGKRDFNIDLDNLKKISKVIKNTIIEYKDFINVETFCDKDTFVYFDPPYRNSPHKYNTGSFMDDDRIELFNLIKRLDSQGTKFLLSEADDEDFITNLYKDFNISKITLDHKINPNTKRKQEELLISNY